MIELFSYSLSFTELGMLALVAILIGMGKTGVQGSGMIAIPILAIIFGGKASTGLLLPILIFADIFGVHHYHQHANWQHLRRLMPYTLLGILIGTAAGDYVNDQLFINIMAVIIFASVGIMIWQQKISNPTVPTSLWFVATIGIVGGFATMVGNLAGPVMALYLLSMQFPKNQFIGTAAWFFLAANVVKVPFHIWVWETITFNSFLLDLLLIPAVALGAWLGVRIVKRIPETIYRWFVIVMTTLAAVALLV